MPYSYILNSSVVTSPGLYSYRLITADEARAWAKDRQFISTVGYEQTAEALTELLGQPVPVDRRTITMEVGDDALVFRLALPPGTPRIDPGDKGRLSEALLKGHYELGLLQKLSNATPSGSDYADLIVAITSVSFWTKAYNVRDSLNFLYTVEEDCRKALAALKRVLPEHVG